MNRKTISLGVAAASLLFLSLALYDIIKGEPDTTAEWIVVALCTSSLIGAIWSWRRATPHRGRI
ncbi:hypothetical protein HZB60_01205 [candidate division KSB1 bacterium]|nr:hypothetical protein [candidate division KSB1 bacterium]